MMKRASEDVLGNYHARNKNNDRSLASISLLDPSSEIKIQWFHHWQKQLRGCFKKEDTPSFSESETIQSILKILGTALGASRVYLFQFSESYETLPIEFEYRKD